MKFLNKKEHFLEEDISPVKRCNYCFQLFSFNKCDCKPKKRRKDNRRKKNDNKTIL